MKSIRLLLFFYGSFFIISCNTGSAKKSGISFDTYQVAEGFEIQLAASEPLIIAPVAMDFDNQNRIWVVEMRGFMTNLEGTGDEIPNGRISILEDFDKNGVAQHSKIFLDSIIMPRALAHVYGGLLYAAPPNLWFVEINNGEPGKKTLVDSLYADGGNVEAQANGLMMGIDNWIYNANSNFRYQLVKGKWLKEPTTFRGQFGISKDDFGRLYYNSNEIQIMGDYVLPNSIISNPYLKPTASVNNILTDNQNLYPLHPTTVNRGYQPGILNKDSLLVKFTAACGPVIYQGSHFPEEYHQNVFVCEPQANLIKRDILNFDDIKTTAKQAWDDKEFIASSDEAFRPVNLFNGPDGALYVVDMHRGIVEYGAFTTPYYNQGIAGKKLDTVLFKGRILRVKYKNKELEKIPDLSKASASELVLLLKSKNGWVRDRAQQLLIFKEEQAVIPELENLARDTSNTISAIHALQTLNGLNALSFDFLKSIASFGNPRLTAHALLLLRNFNTRSNINPMLELVNNLAIKNEATINLYLALSLNTWTKISPDNFLPVLAGISSAYPANPIYQEAVVSSSPGLEKELLAKINLVSREKSGKLIDTILNNTLVNIKEGRMNSIYVKPVPVKNARSNGFVIYKNTCATCHGITGEGLEHIAPPLKSSIYVQGAPARLAMIILNGLEGPVNISGKLSNFNGTMPNFGNNYTDGDIGDIIEYLHNAYVSTPTKSIRPAEIKKLRNLKSGILTEKELLQMEHLDNE